MPDLEQSSNRRNGDDPRTWQVRTGAQKPLERWEFCADTTKQFFGHLLDYFLYNEQVFTDQKRRMFVSSVEKENVQKSTFLYVGVV